MERKYSYSAKTLQAANHKIAANPNRAKSCARQFIKEYFNGLDIPDNCINIAVEKTFSRCSTQEQFNTEAKNYLIKNISRM